MTITVTDPNGASVDFPDGTDQATISRVMSENFGGGEKTTAPISTNSVVRAVATGVPGGGLLNKMDAATNAALAPVLNPLFDDKDQLKEPTFGERYRHSLADQNKMDKDFAEAHPIVDTAAELAGGVASLGGAAAASPAIARGLGMTGRLVPAAAKAAASGAAIGAADAATRDGDPVKGAEIGALTGAGGVAAGKTIGWVWDKVARAWKPVPPTPTRTLDVNGVPVPVRESVMTGDPATSALEQKALHGGMGDEAQRVATEHADATEAALTRAHDEMAARLDPTGAGASTTPQAAGEEVARELASAEQQRAVAEARRLQAADNEATAMRADLAPPNTPQVDTPRTAAHVISDALQTSARRAGAARDAAYEALRTIPGEFSPAAFTRIGQSMRQRLNGGPSPVAVSDTLTPQTAAALRDLENNVGMLQFENQVAPGATLGPDGRPVNPPITAQVIDEARKRLISMNMDARAAARSSGNNTDVRGMRRLIEAFDDHVAQAARNGAFSGDAEQLLEGMSRARELHTNVKRTYGPQNPQDDVGKAIEKIVGKRDVAPAEIETVAPMLFGSATEPGGALPVRIAQRIEEIHGRDSAPFNALRQGVLAHMIDTPAGTAPLSNEQISDRLMRFFGGTKGAGLSQALFSPAERARMLTYARSLRDLTDPAPANEVERLIAKWSGRDGGQRASAKTVVDKLMGESGKNGLSPLIVEHLRTRISERGMTAIKQGVWSRITEQAEGALKWGDQKVGQRIMNFLNGDGKGLADALYTKAERDAMRAIADAHLRNIPVPGTTNPSGSGHLVARMARGARHSLLPIVGFSHGGLPGAALGTAVDKATTVIGNKRAASKAVKLFYGPQVSQRTPVVAPQRFGALAGASAGQSSR
jgi:hypothetical protein